MRYPVFILSAIIVVACVGESKPINILRAKNFVIIDTCSAANEYLGYDENINFSPIYFIGYPKDTFNIGHEYLHDRQEWRDSIKPLLHSYWSRNYSDKTLEITVDTALKTNSQVEYFLDDGTVSEDSTRNFHSFIFTVRNISDSIVYLGHTFIMYYLHTEVKNGKENGLKLTELMMKSSFVSPASLWWR